MRGKMLELKIKSQEYFNEKTSEFVNLPSITLKLEHSLLSISKWEAKSHKRFLNQDKNNKLTSSEMLDYIRCMTLNHDVPDIVYYSLSEHHMEKIKDYIEDSRSVFALVCESSCTHRKSNEAISSELVYYWMTVFNIPFECEKWHFNRLMTLIQICSIKNQPSKKMSKGSVMKQNAALNAARRKAGNTRG